MSKSESGIAVVTGAAAGIGRGIATRLAADGASVAVLDLGDAGETVSAITGAGGKAIGVHCDVADPDSVKAAAEEVLSQLGTPTVLANIAGIYPNHFFTEVSYEDWRKVIAINLDGTFLICQAFAGAMMGAGKGRIINISSAVLATNTPAQAPYFASKMGVIGLTRALANDLGSAGITVNAIAPGLIHTEHVEQMAAGLKEHGVDVVEATELRQAIKRNGEVHDIVEAAAYLASDAAGFVTAQTFAVDGGIMRAA